MGSVLIDFETRSRCDLKRTGAWVYAEHPSTEVLCMGYSEGGDAELWKPGEPLPAFVGRPGLTVIAHNVQFEKAIWRKVLKWPEPERWADTMASCARLALPQSLLEAGRALGLKQVKDQKGKALLRKVSVPGRTGNFDESPEAMRALYAYCRDDVAAERALARRLGPLPPHERAIWEANERLNERGLMIDAEFVKACQAVAEQARGPLAAEFAELTGIPSATMREKFLWWLQFNGAAVPDLSRATLADALEDGEVGGVPLSKDAERAIRLRNKLTAASHAKLQAMLECRGADGRARGLLQYHGAMTGRVAGRLLQPANFPRGKLQVAPEKLVAAIMTRDAGHVAAAVGDPTDAVTTGLRHAIVAGPGKLLVAADFAAIEARLLLALAGAHSALQCFRDGRDIYCEMASKIYGGAVTKADNSKRQVGKCFAAGTPVLTTRGWVPIERVRLDDQLWDGEAWVRHDGLLDQGVKECVSFGGIWATPEHPVWCGERWHRWARLGRDDALRSRVLATGAAAFSASGMNTARGAGSFLSWLHVNVRRGGATQSLSTTGAEEPVPVATTAPRTRQPGGARNITDTPKSCLTSITEIGCWAATNAACASCSAGYAHSKRVYDLANAGPRRRFMILTARGPLVVHNSAVLGLGYAMGWRKFKRTAVRRQPDDFAQRVVETYRKEFAPEVPRLWYGLEAAAARAVWDKKPMEAYGIRYELEDAWLSCRLPSGRKIWYFRPEREKVQTPWGDTRIGFSYTAFKMGGVRSITPNGGHLTENVVQAMARDLLEAAIPKAEEAGLLPVLQVYDEIVAEAEIFLADPLVLEQIMSDIPPWADELRVPVQAEGWVGERYRK